MKVKKKLYCVFAMHKDGREEIFAASQKQKIHGVETLTWIPYFTGDPEIAKHLLKSARSYLSVADQAQLEKAGKPDRLTLVEFERKGLIDEVDLTEKASKVS
jgi:hypothetical protein